MSINVDGVYMDRSLNDFTRLCLMYLEEEQAGPVPDTHLIALLCDAVRLAREMAQLSQRDRMTDEERQEIARYRYLKGCAQGLSLGMDGTQYWHVLDHLFRYKTRTFDEAIDLAIKEERRRTAAPMGSIPCRHCGFPEAEHGFHGRCESPEWRVIGATYTPHEDAEQTPFPLAEGGAPVLG